MPRRQVGVSRPTGRQDCRRPDVIAPDLTFGGIDATDKTDGLVKRLKTIRHTYRIDRTAIAFVKFIIEAYDNLAVVSTLDSREGVVSLAIAPACQDQVDRIMASLGAHIDIVKIDRPPDAAAAGQPKGTEG